MAAAFDLGCAAGRGDRLDGLAVPAGLAEALRLDLRLNLAEFAGVDAGWYRELEALRDAFEDGKRMTGEISQAIEAEIAPLRTKGRAG